MSGSRLDRGGSIDRSQDLQFWYDGRSYVGHPGDTLASALLANGVSIVGRSFKYHRPRGLLGAGVEEPNALMQVGEKEYSEPNHRATEVELYDGLIARAVNCWPNARWDFGAITGLLARFIPAGFYYKTLMWPNWHWFEPWIRRAAGLGRAPSGADPSRYESRYLHCDVLVVGAGPAGMAAALAASKGHARIILCEQDPWLGGSLADASCVVDGKPGHAWLSEATRQLQQRPEVLIKTRTTAAGYFDHNAVMLLERVQNAEAKPAAALPRYVVWQVRAKRVILATGAIERPLIFPGNDRPGVMLASAVRRYLSRYAVLAGRRVVVYTDNDTAYSTAYALLDAGGKVAAIVDRRADPPAELLNAARSRAIRVLTGASIRETRGRRALTAIRVRDAAGITLTLRADVLAVSGGLNPNVHLFSQSGGILAWDAATMCFKPSRSVQDEESVGGAAAIFDLNGALTGGHEAGTRAIGSVDDLSAPRSLNTAPPPTFSTFDPPDGGFVDFQNDVTVADIALAVRENYSSVEHLKRYTTLGMAPDQGKTSSVNGLLVLGHLTGRTPSETGTTRFRFPFTPVPVSALGGRQRGGLLRPLRHLPCHGCHLSAGAHFEDFGGWLRPAYYARQGETREQASVREVRQVRESVGLFDGSPLGKIIVKGPDASRFLDLLSARVMSTLPINTLRYGFLLNEQGVVIDDGVTARLSNEEFWVGTSSGAAARIAEWLEEWRQCEWPHHRLIVAPETQGWAVLTLTGPKAREVLLAAGATFGTGPREFPHMTCRDGQVAGIPSRTLRASYTGEVTYEINVPSAHADLLWGRLMAAGEPYGLSPIGIDAWDVLRTEKGYLHIGADTDATTNASDIGWERVLKRRDDFVGRRSLLRPADQRPDRLQLVGFEPMAGCITPAGSHVQGSSQEHPSDGFITSAAFSPTLDRWVTIGMLRSGRARVGSVVTLLTPTGAAPARVTLPGAYDPQNLRLAS